MISSGTVHRLGFTCLVALPFTAAMALLQPAQAQNSAPVLPEDPAGLQPDLTDPNNLRPLTQDSSLLSLQGGQRLMAEASSAVDAQNYALATSKFQEARQIFNQLSNFYQQLSTSFSGIDNRIFDAQRQKAIETAELRDEATYRLALAHRAQNQPELAVPLLIQIIRSQNPTRDLGQRAYQQLTEMGFTEAQIDSADPNNPQPMAPDGSLLSLPAGQRLMAEASSAIDAQDYVLTAKKLQEARQVFNQLSNFHQQLATSFSGIDNQVFSAQRQKALESALLRDDATYQLALVHRAQNQPELAVPLLIQIIRSQNPTGDLGKKAYQQLFEIGFVDSPYPRPRNSQPTSSATPGS
jgi:hypothetical protein